MCFLKFDLFRGSNEKMGTPISVHVIIFLAPVLLVPKKKFLGNILLLLSSGTPRDGWVVQKLFLWLWHYLHQTYVGSGQWPTYMNAGVKKSIHTQVICFVWIQSGKSIKPAWKNGLEWREDRRSESWTDTVPWVCHIQCAESNTYNAKKKKTLPGSLIPLSAVQLYMPDCAIIVIFLVCLVNVVVGVRAEEAEASGRRKEDDSRGWCKELK